MHWHEIFSMFQNKQWFLEVPMQRKVWKKTFYQAYDCAHSLEIEVSTYMKGISLNSLTVNFWRCRLSLLSLEVSSVNTWQFLLYQISEDQYTCLLAEIQISWGPRYSLQDFIIAIRPLRQLCIQMFCISCCIIDKQGLGGERVLCYIEFLQGLVVGELCAAAIKNIPAETHMCRTVE